MIFLFTKIKMIHWFWEGRVKLSSSVCSQHVMHGQFGLCWLCRKAYHLHEVSHCFELTLKTFTFWAYAFFLQMIRPLFFQQYRYSINGISARAQEPSRWYSQHVQSFVTFSSQFLLKMLNENDTYLLNHDVALQILFRLSASGHNTS